MRAGIARVVLTRDDGENVFIGGGRRREWREPSPPSANIRLEDCGKRRKERVLSMPAVAVAAFLFVLTSGGKCAKRSMPQKVIRVLISDEACFHICRSAYLAANLTDF